MQLRNWHAAVVHPCNRLLSSSPGVLSAKQGPAFYRRFLPKKNVARSKRSRKTAQDPLRRVSAHIMANTHSQAELANALRARFGAGAVQVFGGSSGPGSLASGEIEAIDGVIHLNAPASGTDAAHGSPAASAFFFTGKVDSDGFSSATCVSVWWGAEPSFEDSLLRDLQAVGNNRSSRQQTLDRLAVPRTVLKWQPGARSELGRDEIIIDSVCDQRTRLLDQLSFSDALHRHMKLVLLEEEMDRILSAVKRIVRQGRPSLPVRVLPLRLGGVDSGARTMQVLNTANIRSFSAAPTLTGMYAR